MDLNNNRDLQVQIAIEEETICMAKEEKHENDESYHKAILDSLKKLKEIMDYIEPLRNTNTHNKYLEELKKITR